MYCDDTKWKLWMTQMKFHEIEIDHCQLQKTFVIWKNGRGMIFFLGGPSHKKNDILRIFEIFTV